MLLVAVGPDARGPGRVPRAAVVLAVAGRPQAAEPQEAQAVSLAADMWPAVGTPDPPMALIEDWLTKLRIEGEHPETREHTESVPWLVEKHPGYRVLACSFPGCEHWFIVGRGATVVQCGRHER